MTSYFYNIFRNTLCISRLFVAQIILVEYSMFEKKMTHNWHKTYIVLLQFFFFMFFLGIYRFFPNYNKFAVVRM